MASPMTSFRVDGYIEEGMLYDMYKSKEVVLQCRLVNFYETNIDDYVKMLKLALQEHKEGKTNE